MSGDEGESQGVRTACHGCRTVERAMIGGTVRPVHAVGNGIIVREVLPGRLTWEACPMCGGSGWLPGLQPPT